VNQPPQGDTPAVDQSPADGNTTERDEQSNQTGNESPHQWWADAPAAISAVAAGVSAIFAVLIWLVYRGQWQTMAEQAKYMRDGLAETKQAAICGGGIMPEAIHAQDYAGGPEDESQSKDQPQ
jgi:hypothetical protein